MCVGGRAHTRTHSFSPLWSSSASSPAQLWDVPAAGSCFFLCAALFLAAAGAANLNHHFARLLLYGRLSADCGRLSTKVPPGICNIPESSQNISPNSKHRHTKIFAFFFTAQHSSWSCASRCPALTMAWPPTWSTGRAFRIQPGSHLPLLGTPPKKGGKFIPRRNSRQTTHTLPSAVAAAAGPRGTPRGPLPAHCGHSALFRHCSAPRFNNNEEQTIPLQLFSRPFSSTLF